MNGHHQQYYLHFVNFFQKKTSPLICCEGYSVYLLLSFKVALWADSPSDF